jgi:hypothetical protein
MATWGIWFFVIGRRTITPISGIMESKRLCVCVCVCVRVRVCEIL